MGRARHRYAKCKLCGVTREEVGHITATGKCLDCAEKVMRANIWQLKNQAGPRCDYWRERLAASVGATLLDDL